MVEINISKNIYVYGKFYDQFASQINLNNLLVIYAHPLGIEAKESKSPINSLEGIFISEIPIIKKGDKGVRKDWNLVIEKKHMEVVEEEYQGKFFPFEK